MSTLYEMTSQYEELINLLYDPDWDPDTLIDTLDGIEGEIEEKADGYAKIMSKMDADIAALKAEEKRLKDRRQALENREAKLKDNLYQAMKTLGKTKFRTALYSFGIQATPPSVVIDDEDAVPAQFLKMTVSIDKAKIKEALKTEELPYAHLESGETLRIR